MISQATMMIAVRSSIVLGLICIKTIMHCYNNKAAHFHAQELGLQHPSFVFTPKLAPHVHGNVDEHEPEHAQEQCELATRVIYICVALL